jgi:hypothetical protein
MASSDNGISRNSVLTEATLKAIIVFISLAFYNVGELGFIISATFKRRGGLYFWSFIVATCGIALYGLGFLIKALQLDCPSWLYTTLIVVGWCCMVTGQSVVLYSRLHLVLRNNFRLRLVLAMIITNAVICHVPITVMVYGANSSNPDPFITPYSIYEKVQVTLFFVQETIISGLYIYETVALMRDRNCGGLRSRSGATRWLLRHLIMVNIIIVILDATILGLEYANLYGLQTSYKALVYSVKLKLEFSILNRLVELTTGDSHGHDSSYHRTRAELSGVHMDTLDRERRRKERTLDTAMGNTVHVGSGVGAGADMGPTGASVVMTTEVTVQRRNRLDTDTDVDGDLESIGDRSGRAAGSTAGDTRGQSRPPSHSSERHIIETHY